MNITEVRAAFEDIYRHDRWTHGSGPGSRPESTIEYRAFVERFVRENGVRSVTDLGCGDWQFSRFIDWSEVHYHGFDVVETLVESNRRHFAQVNIQFDLLERVSDLPGGDLLLSKEVLQHLPNDLVRDYLDAIRRKYRWALITNAIEPRDQANCDIRPGDWRPLRLEQAPFAITGAYVFIYYPQAGSHFWRNGVYLIPGLESHDVGSASRHALPFGPGSVHGADL